MLRNALIAASSLALASAVLAADAPANHDLSAGKVQPAPSTGSGKIAVKKYRPWNPDLSAGKVRPEASTSDSAKRRGASIEPVLASAGVASDGLFSDDARDVLRRRSTIADWEATLGSGDETGGQVVIVLRSPDINADGTIDYLDFLAILSQWGACPNGGFGEQRPACDADLSGDGRVGYDDLLIVLANFTELR